MKRLINLTLCCLLPLSAQAGIFGSGNTADSSLQLNFTRSTAALLLKTVTARDVELASSRADLAKLYEQCREVMYLGLLRSRIELVERISDGGKYHALARRKSKNHIEVSRSEIHRLMRANLLTNPLLTALFIHEVAHDCAPNGRPLDDSADPLLNELGLAVLEASGARTFTNFIDIDLIERVARGEKVSFLELSARAQKELVDRWADYFGDSLYLRESASFAARPAPASRFDADARTSVFPGWGQHLRRGEIPASVSTPAAGLLQESIRSSLFTARTSGGLKILPTELRCSPQKSEEQVSAARCSLFVDASGFPGQERSSHRVDFRLDLYGKLDIERIEVKF